MPDIEEEFENLNAESITIRKKGNIWHLCVITYSERFGFFGNARTINEALTAIKHQISRYKDGDQFCG
jgi:hypothetical protein